VPDQAYVYATALGCYKLYRNGELVSFRELTPGCRDHRYYQTYQVYDVIVLLQKGSNVIAAIVVDGWWAASIAWFGKGFYGRVRALRLELECIDEEGSAESVFTDENWLVGTGGLVYADLLHGEYSIPIANQRNESRLLKADRGLI